MIFLYESLFSSFLFFFSNSLTVCGHGGVARVFTKQCNTTQCPTWSLLVNEPSQAELRRARAKIVIEPSRAYTVTSPAEQCQALFRPKLNPAEFEQAHKPFG